MTADAISARRLAFIELAVGYLLILIVIWAPRTTQRPFYIAAVLWIALVMLYSRESATKLGFDIPPRRSLWIIPAALGLAAAAVAVAAALHTLNLPSTPALFIQRYWGYAIWACVQQFLLQDFFLLRLTRTLPTKAAAAVAAALLFSLAHIPNPILVPITLLWGLATCLLFLRYRNLYSIAIAHAILGITVALTIPGPVDHNMRVGLGYLTYHHHHLSQNPHTVSTNACVTAEAPTLRSARHALP
ncbi:hypothetical protein GCM10011507_30790 [Edaphobacter acidisoli]|uniref:CAAX prenyl protease 2/Lysostaphin resistance protein A-like domain-containing protein n=1 Tax=Edaphobacter acidisoli TaxID=2040573 RepID=A0A916RZD5_9BACT|nr:CPBP family glutamic-type intramembrane protease [Edaphobacter acidisoli]GGA77343.1 hypothetical protein GCM10011507_30790 [Edaphobacter acidisoli]